MPCPGGRASSVRPPAAPRTAWGSALAGLARPGRDREASRPGHEERHRGDGRPAARRQRPAGGPGHRAPAAAARGKAPASRGGPSGNGSRRAPAARHAADRARLRPVDHRRTRRYRRAGGLRGQRRRRWTGGCLCRLQDRGRHVGGAGPDRYHQPAAARSPAALEDRRPHGAAGGRGAAGRAWPAAWPRSSRPAPPARRWRAATVRCRRPCCPGSCARRPSWPRPMRSPP